MSTKVKHLDPTRAPGGDGYTVFAFGPHLVIHAPRDEAAARLWDEAYSHLDVENAHVREWWERHLSEYHGWDEAAIAGLIEVRTILYDVTEGEDGNPALGIVPRGGRMRDPAPYPVATSAAALVENDVDAHEFEHGRRERVRVLEDGSRQWDYWIEEPGLMRRQHTHDMDAALSWAIRLSEYPDDAKALLQQVHAYLDERGRGV